MSDLIARLRKLNECLYGGISTDLEEAADALEALQAENARLGIDAAKEIVKLRAEIAEVKGFKDGAYLERNKLVALLSKVFPSGKKKTAIEGWSEDWHGCVYIDLPTGQASWHYHDSQSWLFDHLPEYQGVWDGHTTEEKYERIFAAPARVPQAAREPIAYFDFQEHGFYWAPNVKIGDVPVIRKVAPMPLYSEPDMYKSESKTNTSQERVKKSEKSEQVPLTDEQCDKVLQRIDEWATGYGAQEYGLPLFWMPNRARDVLREALEIKV